MKLRLLSVSIVLLGLGLLLMGIALAANFGFIALQDPRVIFFSGLFLVFIGMFTAGYGAL